VARGKPVEWQMHETLDAQGQSRNATETLQ
jgi:hypothetical protein